MSTVVRTESCFILRLFHVCHKYGSRATLQGTFGSVVGDLQSTVTARDPFHRNGGILFFLLSLAGCSSPSGSYGAQKPAAKFLVVDLKD